MSTPCLLQLKCWLMPGEEEERRRQMEEEKKNAAPPILSAASSSISLASKAGDGAGPGRPPVAGAAASRRGVASRYASSGGFAVAADSSGGDSTGADGGSVLGGLRPPGMFGGAAGAVATGGPAMFKPPSGVFTPAAPVAEEAAADSEASAAGPVESATVAGSRAGSRVASPRAAAAEPAMPSSEAQRHAQQTEAAVPGSMAAQPARADSLDVGAVEARWGEGGGGGSYAAAYEATVAAFEGQHGASGFSAVAAVAEVAYESGSAMMQVGRAAGGEADVSLVASALGLLACCGGPALGSLLQWMDSWHGLAMTASLHGRGKGTTDPSLMPAPLLPFRSSPRHTLRQRCLQLVARCMASRRRPRAAPPLLASTTALWHRHPRGRPAPQVPPGATHQAAWTQPPPRCCRTPW